ncbi:MAG: CotH kinase family protein [Oscillospiraceae bacterium]|nr:CotH kinase family protein [Oscillospiraceae bacterium]
MRRLKQATLTVLIALFASLLCGCAGPDSSLPDAAGEASSSAPAEQAAPAPEPTPAPEGAIRITEVMVKNRTTFRDAYGGFSDWIELYNSSGQDLTLGGWSLSDRENKPGLVFPEFLFPADSYCLVYASKQNNPLALHAPFAVSAGETLWLRDPTGTLMDQLTCPELEADRSWALKADGSWQECLYPTPAAENSTAAYDAWQQLLWTDSPLILNEVMVADPNARFSPYDGSDWVELKNNSASPLSLAGWYLSDDDDVLKKASLPAVTLAPGEITVVRCDQLGLSLNSSNEQLFLSEGDTLRDWLTLRDIPYGGSYGRMDGQAGTFFFAEASPDAENRNGRRRVSAMPVAAEPDGIFDGSEPVLQDLHAEGSIYYTFDSTVPTQSSLPWAGLTQIPASCIIRAVAFEENALPSRTLTLNYFIRQEHSLPIVSLVIDNKTAFRAMYKDRIKDLEWPASVSFYEGGSSFTMPCGVSLHGDTSLVLRKKGMNLNFRGVYGQETLNYDLFGGGVTSFDNLVLRGGQDQTRSILRNELCENLALSASDHIIGTRSRYCILYVDGEYYGIYPLTEKLNEQHYANIAGVSKDSVTVLKATVSRSSELYQDVFHFCETHDMSDPENYAIIQSRLDTDSLIDWVFLEGYFANSDLTFGNLRFCRSAEKDGKWRFMFYDLDATLTEAILNHSILLHRNGVQCTQVSYLFSDLMENSDFRDRFLRRSAELLNGPLSEERVLAELDRLAAELDPEAGRDARMSGRSYQSWKNSVQSVRDFITNNNWTQHNIDAICSELNLSAAERQEYFD